MSKKIKLTEKPQNIFGRPFTVVDFRQTDGVGTSYKCQQCGFEGMTQQVRVIENANLVDLLQMLIVSLPRQKLTEQDSINAYDFFDCCRKADNEQLEVPEGMHDWLKKIAKEDGTAIFGVNAVAITRALDNFERLHEPKEAS